MDAQRAGTSPSPRDGVTGVPEITVLCWNIFHGRDAPPDPSLFTRRSRWRRTTESNATHVQVNRQLAREFAHVLASSAWTVCVLQEAPPAWAAPLARTCGADFHRALTSRNQLGFLTRLLAQWNPDLIGSNEGGSNLSLVRAPWRLAGRTRSLLLNPLARRGLRERRRMGFVRLSSPWGSICVGNLHATTRSVPQAEQDVRAAAEAAVRWAGDTALVLAGDFNLRPAGSDIYEELARRFGLAPVTAPDAIDHILARGVEIVRPPRAWPDERRELTVHHDVGPRRLRLSDHAPVEATFRLERP